MNWINKPFESLLSWLAESILSFGMKVWNGVTDLNFNVDTMLGDNGLIPGMSAIETVISGIAWAMWCIFLYLSLTNQMISSTDGSYKHSPSSIVKKFLMSAILIFTAKPIIAFVFTQADNILSAFISAFDISNMSSFDLSGLATNESGTEAIIVLLFSGILFYNIITSVFNYVERFVMLYISYYLCPIAMSFYASEDNESATKEYFISLITQMCAIMLNLFLFYCFYTKMNSIWSTSSDGSINLNGTVLINLCIAISLLSISKNSEKIFNEFGLHTMPSPSSTREFLSGLGGTMAVVGGFAKATNAGTKIVGSVATMTANGMVSGSVGQANKLIDPNLLKTMGDGHKLSAEDIAKKAQESNFKTSFDKENKKLSATGNFNDEDKKQIATEIGAVSAMKGKSSAINSIQTLNNNKKGLDAVNSGIDLAQSEMRSSLDKTNDFLSGKSENLTNTDVSKALGLDKTMPNFIPSPDGNVRRLSNGDFAIDGTMQAKKSDGSYQSRPVTMAISSEDRGHATSQAGHQYIGKGINATADGGLKAYEVVGATATSSAYNTLKATANSNAHLYSNAEAIKALQPEKTMNGMSIDSGLMMTKNNDGFFMGTEANKDGSITQSTWMLTENDYTNGQVVGGFETTPRRYALGVNDETGSSIYAIQMNEASSSALKSYENAQLEGLDKNSDEYQSVLSGIREERQEIFDGLKGHFENPLSDEDRQSISEELTRQEEQQNIFDHAQEMARDSYEEQDAIDSGHPTSTFSNDSYTRFVGNDDLVDTSKKGTVQNEDGEDFIRPL